MDLSAGRAPPPKAPARPPRLHAADIEDIHRCHTLSDLQRHLAERYEGVKDAFIPEQLDVAFRFYSDAIMGVRNMSDEVRHSFGIPPSADGGLIQLGVPTIVTPVSDKNMKSQRQRVVLEEILRLIESVDGFHWVIKTTQESKTLDGYRFGYTCCDSYQNKDRAINRKRKLDGNFVGDIKLGWFNKPFEHSANQSGRTQDDSHV